jgi:hypothetical protein
MARYNFEFQATGRSLELCEATVDRMVELFGISVDEALGRVNRQWRGFKFEDIDLIGHETDDYWARTIYYGADSYWWLKPADLKPRPYP